MSELYVYIFVKHYAVYATLWPLEEWHSVQKVSIDSFLCHLEKLNNKCKLFDILLMIVF